MNLFILLFVAAYTCATDTTTSPPSTTVTSADENMQKIIALTEGISAITEVFNSPEPVGRNLTKLLSASRKCGMVLHAGFSLDGIVDSSEVEDLRNKSSDLNSAILEQQRHISPDIFPFIVYPLRNLMSAFSRMWFYSSDDFSYFKETCARTYLLGRIEELASETMLFLLEVDVIVSGYSDIMIQRINKTYYHSLKQMIGFYPLCNIFNNGLPNAQDQQQNANVIIQALKTIHQKFIHFATKQKTNYWNKEVIEELIKKRVMKYYKSTSNYLIGLDIYYDIYERYNSLGYNYHVMVSDAAQRGHNDTLIQCSTECHYLYNFLEKDVYVMRTKKSDNYSTCEYLQNRTTYGKCYSTMKTNESLEPLANEIAEHCQGVAFSLVRDDERDYFATGSCRWIRYFCDLEEQGFTSRCHDGVNVVFANYPG